MKRLLAFLLILCATLFASAQNQRSQEEQLGIQYYQNGEYEKAAPMFEKVFNANPNSYIYYYYYQTLLQLGDFKEAEKVVKKQQKKFPNTQRYKTDLGYVYESAGEQEKANLVYANAIKELPANEHTIRELYNAFLARRQYEYAITTIERGRRLLNNNMLFVNEMTSVYIQTNRTDLVVEEALLLVSDGGQGRIPEVQKIIQKLLSGDEDRQKLRTTLAVLQRKTQENPGNIAYEIILQWAYQLDKNYDDALLLAKAIDRKLKGDGQRVYALAKEANANKSFDAAIAALQYIIEKGESNPYFTNAQFLLLDVKYEKLSSTSPIDKQQASELEKEFARILEVYGLHEGTAEWTRKYAHLLAFYVEKPEEAKALLNQAIAQANRDVKERAQYKVDLADIQLYMGDVWEASLLYSQVDKDLPTDIIGQTAKYKNAKLSFYIGEFEWAKSQLDVLRAATSKLIANDAMYFSLLITDNEEESEEDAGLFADGAEGNQSLRYYAKADFLLFQNKEEEASQMLDSVLIVDPYGKLADDVYYQKAKIAIKRGDYLGAQQLLDKILSAYSYDLLGDDATYLMAQVYDYYLKDSGQAMGYYQKILTDYPDSLYTIDARKRYRELRGDFN
ncbi:MAG: tetratricopeptide repeat protein [Bacteroidales bacterium]|jgi:tetratricopeptide (TPR) repeat protein|nr:tetratricopeptide repeat protein [Bacteroidales bacterium]MCR5115830.1 tetratricopeptide repeat protein [Bacteroidales bacterium]